MKISIFFRKQNSKNWRKFSIRMVFKNFLTASFGNLTKKDLIMKCLRLRWKWFEDEGRYFAIGWRWVEIGGRQMVVDGKWVEVY